MYTAATTTTRMGCDAMKKIWFRSLFLMVMCVAVLVGCSSEKTANKENFKKAITEWQQQYGGYLAGTGVLPTTLPVDRAPKLLVRNFAALSFAGMVTVVKEPIAGSKIKTGGQLQYKYSLTELGKKYYVPGKGFKATAPEVTDIGEFADFVDTAAGAPKAVTVKYKYRDVPTELGKIVNKTEKAEVYDGVQKLVLTDSGWKVSPTNTPVAH